MKHIIEKIKNPKEFEDGIGDSWILLIYDDETNEMKYQAFPYEIIEGHENIEFDEKEQIYKKKAGKL